MMKQDERNNIGMSAMKVLIGKDTCDAKPNGFIFKIEVDELK